MTTTGIALLGGAGLGPSIWNELLPHIDLPCLAVTFPEGDDHKGRKNLSLQDYSEHVTRQIENWDGVDEVVLVAHSIGGTVGVTVASELSRLKSFIGIAAAIPQDGESFISTLPRPKRLVMTALLKIAGTRPPDSAIRAGLCNGLGEEQVNEIIRDFKPESKGLYLDQATNRLNVSCHYIRTQKDKEFTTNQMTQMAQNLPEVSIADIDTGHLPMIQQPKELATLINRIV